MKNLTPRQYHDKLVQAQKLVREAKALALKLDISDGTMLEEIIESLDRETLAEFSND